MSNFVPMTAETLQASLEQIRRAEEAPATIEKEEIAIAPEENVADGGESLPETEENVEPEESVEPAEEAKEENVEPDAGEDIKEADNTPKLKALLKREQKLLEEKRGIEAEKAKIEAEKAKLEESLKKYDMTEIEKIQKVSSLLKEGKGKKELFDLVGVSPKEFLKKSFEFNPAFVRETFKELLADKQFNPEEDEISKEKKALEEEKKALEAEKAEKKLSQTKEVLYNTIDFSKSSILSALPKEEVEEALYDTAIALLQKRPELKVKPLKEIVSMVSPAIEQVYKKKYEKLASVLLQSKTSTVKTDVNKEKGKKTPSNSSNNTTLSPSQRGVGDNKVSASGASKDALLNEIQKLPVKERATALLKAGLL